MRAIQQTLIAVNEFHEKNLFHQNLLPENVLYDNQEVKSTLIDFDSTKMEVFLDKKHQLSDLNRLIHGAEDTFGLLHILNTYSYDECINLAKIKTILRNLADGGVTVIDAALDIAKQINVTVGNKKSLLIFSPKGNNLATKTKNILSVLHASLECKGAEVGDLGAVIIALIPQQNKYIPNQNAVPFIKASLVTPYYNFFDNHMSIEEISFIGYIEHLYNAQEISSQVFFTEYFGIPQYLISPPGKIKNIFDVGSASNIYKSFPHSEFQNRYIYVSSAIAAFATSGLISCDILQIHQWQLAFAASLVKEKYSKNNLPKIIYTIHMLGYEQGILENSIEAENIGLHRSGLINQMAESMLHADYVTAVSQSIINEACIEQSGYGLSHLFRQAIKSDRCLGITNGILTANYNPSNVNIFRELAYTANQDIVSSKKAIKEFLHNKKLIADPSKPLIMYVGRYSSEKGVDMLPEVASIAREHGASIIIMGCVTDDVVAAKIITDLHISSITTPDLHVMLTMEEQQELGHYVRAASDFVIIPSHLEACGLVAMEAMCFGAMIISSNVQGLKDCLIDITQSPETGNAFTYFNGEGNIANLKNCIKKSLFFWNELSDEKKNLLHKRIMQSSSKFDWNVDNGSLCSYAKVYSKVSQQLKTENDVKMGIKFAKKHFP
jgi:starch synthase